MVYREGEDRALKAPKVPEIDRRCRKPVPFVRQEHKSEEERMYNEEAKEMRKEIKEK